jgi:hypothetical protein
VKEESIRQRPENIEMPETVNKALRQISDTEKFVSEQTGLTGAELVAATDDTLTFVANGTKMVADSDGIRTEDELEDIKKTIEPIVVEDAIEQTGAKTTTGDNAIITRYHLPPKR